MAEEGDAFHYGAGLTYAWDSNLFRQDSASPGGAPSDNLANYYGIVGFDKYIGRQELYGDFTIGRTKFSRFSELDYDNQDITTGWKGYFPHEIRTKFEWLRSQRLANFADLLVVRRNVITSDTLNLDLDVPVYANWHAVGGADLVRIRNSHELDQSNNLDGNGFEGGVRYVTPYGNRLDLVYRETESRFPDRAFTSITDTAYREHNADLRIYWQFSGSNSLEGRAGYLSRDHETLSYRNFSGPSFQLADTWQITASTMLVARIYRKMGDAGDNAFNYAVTKGVRFEPTWNTTAKISVHGALEWSDRRYLGNVYDDITGLSASPDRDDKTFLGSLGVTYTPVRWMQLSADYRGERRNSNQALLDYEDHLGSLTVQLMF
jgi:exopolysaccharide biosynthesis operon protein EpsL